jgi:hypothetical protein
MSRSNRIGEQTMKQTMVQMSRLSDAGIRRRIQLRDGSRKVYVQFLSGKAAVRAAGHEGHVMPMSPGGKPEKGKNKPEKPLPAPAPPVAKPPVKKAKNRVSNLPNGRLAECSGR